MEKFENKVVLITGGTSGIGLATAQRVVQEGAKVIITGRFQKTIDQTIKQLGAKAFGIVADNAKISDILSLPQKIRQIAPTIDMVFVNAGFGRFAPIEAVTEADFDELFSVLVKSSFFTVQQLLPLLNKGGSVIFNTSVVTAYGAENMSVYAAAKSAVQSLVKTFAAEYAPQGIRINAVSPGYTISNGFEKAGVPTDQIEGLVKAIAEKLPLKRFAQANEIANAVCFLASDEASYIQGTELVVDGGYLSIR